MDQNGFNCVDFELVASLAQIPDNSMYAVKVRLWGLECDFYYAVFLGFFDFEGFDDNFGYVYSSVFSYFR